jgi:hypothetical protein
MTSFRRHWQPGRAVVELGFALIAVGALIDVAYHLWWSGDDRRGGLGLLGHVVTLAGMVIAMAGVVATGLRSSVRRS